MLPVWTGLYSDVAQCSIVVQTSLSLVMASGHSAGIPSPSDAVEFIINKQVDSTAMVTGVYSLTLLCKLHHCFLSCGAVVLVRHDIHARGLRHRSCSRMRVLPTVWRERLAED